MVATRTVVFAVALLLVAAAASQAQPRRSYWGISGGFVPEWSVPEYQELVFDAEVIDLQGTSWHVGFVRGAVLRGHWGVSLVRRQIDDRDLAMLRNDGTVLSTRANTLLGVEVSAYKPFATIKDRVQIGLSYGIGVGQYLGDVIRASPGQPSDVANARVLFSPGDLDIAITPLGHLELAGGVILSPRVKIMVSGGVNFPGQHKINVGAVYFF